MRPLPNDYFPYLDTYISKVKEENAVAALEQGQAYAIKILTEIPPEKWDYAYAANKWNVKEVVQHVLDTERIFATRALAFARGETQILPSFDENQYALHSEATIRTPEDLLEEFKSVRASSIHLFKSFSDHTLQNSGIVPAGRITVNALGYAICGHMAHHLQIIQERYLK